MVNIEVIKKIIKESNNVVFFGGAGVSTASNIPDFRSSDGLYFKKDNLKFSPEEVLSNSFFFNYPEYFYEFYKEKMIYQDAKPNNAHLALAKLEQQNKLKAVITQNIDNLHQFAGSKNVLELHGSVYRNYCVECNKFFDLNYILNSIDVPYCDSCNGLVKPDVVLYGEQLNHQTLVDSIKYIKQSDCFIVGGTSLSVYPAASLVSYYEKNKLILINKTPTQYDTFADYILTGDIAEILKELVFEKK